MTGQLPWEGLVHQGVEIEEPPIDSAVLAGLHREMARGRAIEEEVLRLTEERRFTGFYHPGRGQEAVPAGACSALNPDDVIFYAHRGLTYLTAKGMDPVSILGDFVSTTAGSTGGLGAGTVHCVDPANGVLGQGGTLGSCFPLATGAALGFRLQGTDQVAMAFFGDGASARGTFLESAVFAVARKLPVIFICENNGFALSVRIDESQGVSSITPRAEGFGLAAETVDGFDVVAVRNAAVRAVERARRGEGPSFIEATTIRGLGHYVGDLQPYRDDKRGPGDDPIDRAEARLRSAGVEDRHLQEVREAAATEMRAATEEALRAPRANQERLLLGLWSDTEVLHG